MGQVDPDGLAALLLTLKERSGLSYGVLARRLHMSTSTVHRYCNGETVPLDYAPVERFARLGRATPDELTELHRRWVIANERRQDRPPAAPKPAPEVEIRPAADPVVPPPARRYRRWLVGSLIAAVLVPAVIVPVVAQERRDDDPKRAALQPVDVAGPSPSTSAPATTAAASPSRVPSPAARPSAGRTPAAASRTPAPVRSSSGSSGETTLDTGPPPLHVTVTPYGRCEGRDILVDRPPSGVSPPPEVANTSAWVSAFDGIQAGGQEIAVTVQGTSDRTVVLQALHVRTTTVAEPPTAGSVYALDDGCGGGVPTTSFSLDLDAPHPEPRAPKVDALPRKVSQSDPEELLVDTTVKAHDVAWYLELDWSSGGRHGTMRIDDHGRPFHNTGAQGRPQYYFDYDAHQWKPV